MSNVCSEALSRTTGLQVPSGPDRTWQIVLGVINCFFFGVGVMIAGCMDNNMADVLIGVAQLLIPFVGWLWAIIWGILMIINK